MLQSGCLTVPWLAQLAALFPVSPIPVARVAANGDFGASIRPPKYVMGVLHDQGRCS